jgi:hypothetical protein
MNSTTKHFSTVEYIKKLRAANFTEKQADIVAEAIELQNQQIHDQHQEIHDQRLKIENLNSKELATKVDLRETKKELELAIEKLRYDTLKFILWTGVGVSFTLIVTIGGLLAKGFGWL